MGGGLMQLVAYGAQDIYLTGNPQITFFKVVYRRHTNFSMETIQQTVSGTSLCAGGSGTVTLSRNGDLVTSIYVTTNTSGVHQGSAIVKEAELEIGGQLIDRQYEEWNDIWNELTIPDSKARGFKCMISDIGESGVTGDAFHTTKHGVGVVQIPLNFWFCRNPGLALPLIALQYHEVKIIFSWGKFSTVGAEANCKVWCDYIYLDTDERRRFAQVSHEYLIEQIQKQGAAGTKSTDLRFNHPVKELIWTSAFSNTYGSAQLKFNGHDRFAPQEAEYFQLRQPYQFHTAIPGQNLPLVYAATHATFVNVAVLNQPTGTQIESGNVFTLLPISFAAINFTGGGQVPLAGQCIVSQGGTGEPLADVTAAVTVQGQIETPTTLIYTFITTDFVEIPNVGDEVLITVTGTEAANTETDPSKTFVIHTHVTQAHVGSLKAGLTSANNIHFQFDDALLERAALGAEVDAATHFTITNFEIRSGQGGYGMCRTGKMSKKINVYSFGLKPEEHQPSGTCNFSRIDTAILDTTVSLSASDNIYAVNYNVLRIMSGMGGLAYSN